MSWKSSLIERHPMLKIWANLGLFFVYFRPFLIPTSIKQRVDGVLGTGTRGHRIVGAEETTELCRPPRSDVLAAIFCPSGL